MQITLIGAAAIAVFGFLGYRRGLYQIMAAFSAFFVAALLARPASAPLADLLAQTKLIPLALTPLAGLLLAGILLFLLLYAFAALLLRKLESRREARDRPRIAIWERLGGAVLGAAWGSVLFLLVMVGILMIGDVAEALNRTAPAAAPAEQIVRASPAAARQAAAASAESAADAGAPATAPKDLPPLERNAIALKNQIEGSVLAPVIRKANPVNSNVAETFHNLSAVVNDPVLYQEFKRHPLVSCLSKDPRILAVSEDQQIQQMLHDKQYYALLDNGKIAALLKDEALVRELRKVNISEILKEVTGESPMREFPAKDSPPAATCDKCLGSDGKYKDAYESESKAAALAQLFQKKYGLTLHAYACPFGNGWHLTQTKGAP